MVLLDLMEKNSVHFKVKFPINISVFILLLFSTFTLKSILDQQMIFDNLFLGSIHKLHFFFYNYKIISSGSGLEMWC